MEAQGRTGITHREDCWLLAGTLKVPGALEDVVGA